MEGARELCMDPVDVVPRMRRLGGEIEHGVAHDAPRVEEHFELDFSAAQAPRPGPGAGYGRPRRGAGPFTGHALVTNCVAPWPILYT